MRERSRRGKSNTLAIRTAPISSTLFHLCFRGGLRWLETLVLQFLVLSKIYILVGYYTHSISVDAKITVSRNYPLIGEHVTVIFVAQLVTIATA